MSASLIWWSCVSIEVFLLLRGTLTGLLKKYPLFYIYVVCVLLKEVVGLLSYQLGTSVYESLYWPAELATVVASYAVIVEIFRHSLKRNSVVARIAQELLIVVFAGALVYAALDLVKGKAASVPRATVELGRDLRYVEAALLFVMLWLFLRYRILIGRNLLGLILGYSFWVGLNVINLALWFLPGKTFSIGVRTLLPITYLITLMIWCASLWSSQPDPVPRLEGAIAQEYEPLVGKTRNAFAAVSTSVARTMRP
jgi:hypothetical protein